MTQDELNLVLDALKFCHGGEPCGTGEAIVVVEKALAQKQEFDYKLLFDELAEKFALLRDEAEMWKKQALFRFDATATPPHRTWVGLSEDELERLIHNFGNDPHTLLDEVDARLRNRNT